MPVRSSRKYRSGIKTAGRLLSTASVLIATLIGVNVALALYLWLPRTGITAAFVPIPETMVLVLLVYIAPDRRWVRVVLGALAGVLIGFSLVEAVFQFVYARSLESPPYRVIWS